MQWRNVQYIMKCTLHIVTDLSQWSIFIEININYIFMYIDTVYSYIHIYDIDT